MIMTMNCDGSSLMCTIAVMINLCLCSESVFISSAKLFRRVKAYRVWGVEPPAKFSAPMCFTSSEIELRSSVTVSAHK